MKGSSVDYSQMSIDERKNLLGKIYILYPRLSKILESMAFCYEQSKYFPEPECLFIEGRSGVGKTTMYKYYMQQFPKEETNEGRVVPILFARIQVPATVSDLVTELLTNLGDPAAEIGTVGSRARRLRKLIERCRVRLIILDEFQHFIDRDSQKILKTISDWLKNLIEDTKVPVILIGMPGSDAVLDANDQLNRRFSAREILDPFKWKTVEQKNEFRSFLKMLDEKLPLTEEAYLAEETLAFRFFCASRGVVGIVIKIIRRASIIALQEGKENISLEILAEAYDKVIRRKIKKKLNPFRCSIQDLEHKPPKEPAPEHRVTNNRIKGKKPKKRASDVLSRR